MQVLSLDWKDSMEEKMATHSSIFEWEIPWTEEPDGLESLALQRVRHDLVCMPIVILMCCKSHLLQLLFYFSASFYSQISGSNLYSLPLLARLSFSLKPITITPLSHGFNESAF